MITISLNGKRPKQASISTEQALILSAWAYGLKENESIHRFPLFAFVQSHINSLTEENLQGSIEKDSTNWESVGDGFYKLTFQGYKKISKYGLVSSPLPQNAIFTFRRTINQLEISVTIDRGYLAKQNGHQEKTYTIIDNIKSLSRAHLKNGFAAV